jgi:hypothetical protein
MDARNMFIVSIRLMVHSGHHLFNLYVLFSVFVCAGWNSIACLIQS